MTGPTCVVISTRDRGPAIVRTIRSILEDGGDRIEIIVVDQSDNGATDQALHAFAGDGRVRYLRTDTRGISVGRNVGIRAATSNLVVITDDDCEAPRGWLDALLAPIDTDPTVGIVVSSVIAAPHDAQAGCIPAFIISDPFVIRSTCDPHLLRGMGPSLALRRRAWEAVGGFDETLGVGGRFRAGVQPDFYLRVVAAGYAIHGTATTALIHHGFRPWERAGDSLRDYCYGGGALWAKHVKRAPGPAAALLFRLAMRWAVGRSAAAASISRRPSRGLRLAAFARGFVAGALTRVDPATGHFAPASRTVGERHPEARA